MAKFNSNKGLSIIESLVCLVIIGIGFIAVSQLTSFAIGSMDRSMERTKVNFLSEMIIEDMMGDPDNATNYSFDETCTHNTGSESRLSDVQKNKWKSIGTLFGNLRTERERLKISNNRKNGYVVLSHTLKYSDDVSECIFKTGQYVCQ